MVGMCGMSICILKDVIEMRDLYFYWMDIENWNVGSNGIEVKIIVIEFYSKKEYNYYIGF